MVGKFSLFFLGRDPAPIRLGVVGFGTSFGHCMCRILLSLFLFAGKRDRDLGAELSFSRFYPSVCGGRNSPSLIPD